MSAMIWVAVAFFCGSLPLSVWLGKLALGKDITQYGDNNPGAANVWRAGGAGWGFFAVLLDSLKGAIPVGLANFLFKQEGVGMVAVALAPIVGHAFSPFLRFRGGKALSVTFGIWAGLTLWIVPITLGLFSALFLALLRPAGWAVLASLVGLGIVLLAIGNPTWLGVWAGTVVILGWMHRKDLKQSPRWRSH